ncbi:hypothetical protein H6H01_30990 [Nostoc calcicola FACHB-3891]|nr:hypothetical protein [Nostoc calcicola FACHB-3891]
MAFDFLCFLAIAKKNHIEDNPIAPNPPHPPHPLTTAAVHDFVRNQPAIATLKINCDR